ncbi:MAG: hypothetical protein J6J27_04240 [Alphaproteobacteria bacterium]|nr:hypothetical protein [Alphaproteobacteria bacterium]
MSDITVAKTKSARSSKRASSKSSGSSKAKTSSKKGLRSASSKKGLRSASSKKSASSSKKGLRSASSKSGVSSTKSSKRAAANSSKSSKRASASKKTITSKSLKTEVEETSVVEETPVEEVKKNFCKVGVVLRAVDGVYYSAKTKKCDAPENAYEELWTEESGLRKLAWIEDENEAVYFECNDGYILKSSVCVSNYDICPIGVPMERRKSKYINPNTDSECSLPANANARKATDEEAYDWGFDSAYVAQCKANFYAVSIGDNYIAKCEKCPDGTESSVGAMSINDCKVNAVTSVVEEAVSEPVNDEESLKKAEEERAAAEKKKAEEEKAAAEKKKAEEEKAAAEKKAEEERVAAEKKKAEEERIAAEKKKAEEEEKKKVDASSSCKAGSYYDEITKSCLTCFAGTYSKDGAKACVKCPAGTYNDQSGATECKKCDFVNSNNFGNSNFGLSFSNTFRGASYCSPVTVLTSDFVNLALNGEGYSSSRSYDCSNSDKSSLFNYLVCRENDVSVSVRVSGYLRGKIGKFVFGDNFSWRCDSLPCIIPSRQYNSSKTCNFIKLDLDGAAYTATLNNCDSVTKNYWSNWLQSHRYNVDSYKRFSTRDPELFKQWKISEEGMNKIFEDLFWEEVSGPFESIAWGDPVKKATFAKKNISDGIYQYRCVGGDQYLIGGGTCKEEDCDAKKVECTKMLDSINEEPSLVKALQMFQEMQNK